MIELIIKAIRERLASRLWWTFVVLALAAFVLLRVGQRMYALSLLGMAQSKYRDFLAHRRVRLYDRLANWKGTHRFLAVVKARNPGTGELATDTLWILANSAEQARKRIKSGEWGKDFSLVSLANSGKGLSLPALASKAGTVKAVWEQARAFHDALAPAVEAEKALEAASPPAKPRKKRKTAKKAA